MSYQCPNCQDDVEVDTVNSHTEVICTSCNTKLEVCYDADQSDDGRWHDLTKLKIINDQTPKN